MCIGTFRNLAGAPCPNVMVWLQSAPLTLLTLVPRALEMGSSFIEPKSNSHSEYRNVLPRTKSAGNWLVTNTFSTGQHISVLRVAVTFG